MIPEGTDRETVEAMLGISEEKPLTGPAEVYRSGWNDAIAHVIETDQAMVIDLRCPCPTPCDDDCEATCHEAHQIRSKREHDVETCGRRDVRVVDAADYDRLSNDSARLRELLGDEDPTLRVVDADLLQVVARAALERWREERHLGQGNVGRTIDSITPEARATVEGWAQ